MSHIDYSPLLEAQSAVKDASQSAGKYAGYVGITTLSVAFCVVVLVTVAQQAVVWTHKAVLADKGALSPSLTVTDRVGHRASDLPAKSSSANKGASAMPAYGAGLNARIAVPGQDNS